MTAGVFGGRKARNGEIKEYAYVGVNKLNE